MFGAMQHNHPISSSSIQITTSSNNNINYLIQQVSYNYKKFTTTKIKYARLRRAFSSKPQFRFFCQSKVFILQRPLLYYINLLLFYNYNNYFIYLILKKVFLCLNSLVLLPAITFAILYIYIYIYYFLCKLLRHC